MFFRSILFANGQDLAPEAAREPAFFADLNLDQAVLETRNLPEAIFLRVERQSDGRRTFKLRESGPLETGNGEDLYNRIFMLASGRATHDASSKCAADHV